MEIDLPEDSLFHEQDYRQMAALVDDEDAQRVLAALNEDGLCLDELVDRLPMDARAVSDTLEDLRGVALASMHRRPNRANRRYHRRTRLGTVVLDKGRSGVRQLAEEEWDIADQYSRRR